MFVVVAVEAQQLPVAAVTGIVVMVVVLVVDGEFAHPLSAEFPRAGAADVREQLECLLPVAPFALLAVSAGLCDDTVGIGFFQGSVPFRGEFWNLKILQFQIVFGQHPLTCDNLSKISSILSLGTLPFFTLEPLVFFGHYGKAQRSSYCILGGLTLPLSSTCNKCPMSRADPNFLQSKAI